jgi:hypothetical protein
MYKYRGVHKKHNTRWGATTSLAVLAVWAGAMPNFAITAFSEVRQDIFVSIPYHMEDARDASYKI